MQMLNWYEKFLLYKNKKQFSYFKKETTAAASAGNPNAPAEKLTIRQLNGLLSNIFYSIKFNIISV